MSKQYTAPPAMTIDLKKKYTAVFHTDLGEFEAEL